MGEEDGIDQLGLAARELGHEGHHDLVGAHLLFQPLQALLHRGVQQILGHQPFTQLLQLGGKAPSPGTILTNCSLNEADTSTPLVCLSRRVSHG
jgi:hypothetical protein